jgi:flagellar assembly factor FliW
MEIDEKQLIRFPKGLLGFERFTSFALLDAEQAPFFHLQSTDDRNLSFVLIDPFVFRPDYQIDLDDVTLSQIGLSDPKDALVFAIVTIPPGGEPVTANLMGPVIVNKRSRIAMQAVLSDPRWMTKHDIVAEMRKG